MESEIEKMKKIKTIVGITKQGMYILSIIKMRKSKIKKHAIIKYKECINYIYE